MPGSVQQRGPGEVDQFWLWLARSVFYPVTFGLAKTEIRHGDRLPASGGAIVAMNHITHIDPLYDSVLMDQLHRMPHFLAKHSLFEKPVAKQVMYGTGQIPVYRGTDRAVDSLAAAREAITAGEIVIIYPEGTCTRDPDGWPMVARNGVARLALETGAPVIPAARWGTLSIMNLYEKRFTPLPRAKVTLSFGEPLDVSAYHGREPTSATLTEITDLCMDRVRGLLADIRGQRPPEKVYDPREHKGTA